MINTNKKPRIRKKKTVLTSGQDWSFELIEEIYGHIDRIAKEKFKLDTYQNQIEIITSEQMLDAYSAVGMPIYYNHWSFGKMFTYEQEMYKRGHMGLAYEIVINSNPCISYLMEENTMMMQALVIAHAAFGHNAFFKNNYLFQQWTDAEGIIDYLVFAKKYITECEEKYGIDVVEEVLDACHSLKYYGVDKYKRPPKLSPEQEKQRTKERNDYIQSRLNDLWRTIPTNTTKVIGAKEEETRFPNEPQENILYFIEKNAPNLDPWKRELIRIVRKVSQYFYPQIQTKMMNEGFACFIHYNMMYELYNEGLVNDGFMLEFFESHTNVVTQRDYNSKQFNGINPYALGFAIFQDIKRICVEPTDEDKEWFPEWAGNNNWVDTVLFAMKNFKDDSFILQYLSPKVIRDFKLFVVLDDHTDPKLEITAIHDKSGYVKVREALSRQYNIGYHIPDIQVYNVDRWGDRSLTLKHFMTNVRPLNPELATRVLEHLTFLWGYDVNLKSIDQNNNTHAVYTLSENNKLLDIFVDHV